MTVDDENSVYVGGIRYDCTEDDLRNAFDLYGSILAVKMINDRVKGGKCYAFVTFTNPRAAADAIRGMNGRTIGGRTVKVNEVTTRGEGARPNYGSEVFRHNERSTGFIRGRGRDRFREEHERDRYRDRSGQRERGYELTQGEKPRGRFYDRDDFTRDHDREIEQDNDSEFDKERQSERVGSLDRRIEKENQDDGVDRDSLGRGIRKDKDQHMKKNSRSSSYEQHGREFSTESSDYHKQEQFNSLNQRREELKKEKSEMELKLKEKNQLILDLRRKSLKLEDALTSAKKVSSLRQTQLTKLYKCFLQVKDYGERLKSSEQELQALAESLMLEIDASGGGGARISIENGDL
ncbi:hypothetical protein V2J09_010282 [Rumex salicifolius]